MSDLNPKRCKHENAEFLEMGTSATSHVRELDGRWSHASEFGNYTGVIDFTCLQCGMKRTYTTKRRPQWLVERLAEFMYTPDSAA